MKVEQVLSKDLKREYKVTVKAKDIDEKVDAKLKEVGKKVKLDGFRPGKIPSSVLKKNYGQRVLGEVLQNVVDESSKEALVKEKVRPALPPKIEIIEFEEGSDLKFKIEVEVLPELPKIDFKKITIEKPKVEVGKKDIEEAINRIAEQVKDFEKVDRKSKDGDAVLIDFKGFVDDEAFEGGEAQGHRLVLGSNSFIPGFEEQLIGTKAGDDKKVKVAFPKEYHAPHLAGKDSVFEVTVHEVLEAKSAKIDKKFAEKLGFDEVSKLEDAIKEQIEKEVEGACRTYAKKELFDELDKACKFDVPEEMAKQEFEAVWHQIEHAKQANPNDPEFNKPEKKLKEEYKEMADRRVRLGILLSDIGVQNKIAVTPEEINRVIFAEASRFPGQEQKVFEHYKSHPEQVEAIKGPLLEEKVVDFILEKVSIKDKKMTIADLQDFEQGGGNTKKSTPKKKAAKKDSKKTKK